MGRYSSSDSDYSRESSSSRRKKKSRKKRRSSSPSSDYSHRSSGKRGKSGKRRSRSRSRSSDRESGSASKRRKRSRSRDRPRDSRSSRRSRSRSQSRRSSKRSRSRERSHERRERKKKSSHGRSASPPRRKKHVDAVLGLSTGTLKDVLDIVPGFSKMTPAEQSKIRIQRGLQAAVDSSKYHVDVDEEETAEKSEAPIDFKAQIERANAIQELADSADDDDDDDDSFMPTHFKSSVKLKKKLEASRKADPAKTTFVEREGTHELAIFGHNSMLSLDDVLKMKKNADKEALSKAKHRVDFAQRDPASLFAEELLVSAEEASARWADKLRRLRQKYLGDGA